ncbi:Salicylate hydroxylase [Burkholderiales bacterium 8X]|nr:Salicylate hydroxylase [Burkholderiales bacterium 8X]
MPEALRVLVVGGGIGGLAAALALGREPRRKIQLFEQAGAFGEIGAGIQLGPNVTRRLASLGLEAALTRIAARPRALNVRSAVDNASLASMPLGGDIALRYGAPYLCVHRADLHAALLAAVREGGAAELILRTRVGDVMSRREEVCVSWGRTQLWWGDLLVGADGLWSALRPFAIGDTTPPRATGHMAWRALVEQSALPEALRSQDVTVWLGERLHVVAYPVRAGEALNVVVLAEADAPGDLRDWSQDTSLAALRAATGRTHGALQALFEAMPGWKAWALHDRPPLVRPSQMATRRAALVGDAAHPMLPYLAQGAGMAIEDAVGLAEALEGRAAADVPAAVLRYAAARWERNAKVQARARRNGEIFHATGALRLGRDTALRMFGSRLLDVPWLYHG